MNYYNETEKSLKRWLKSKVKITMATVVGFLIAGTVSFGAGTIPEDGVYTNDVVINQVGSTKFIKGSNGNLVINTNGSVGKLLSDLQKHHGSISEIIKQLGVQDKDNLVVVGAVAGEGKYDVGIEEISKKLPSLIGDNGKKISDIINRTNTKKDNGIIEKDTNTIIGNDKSSPLVLGIIGGDMIVGIGKIENGFFWPTISPSEEEIVISRKGKSTVNINNGNVFGGSVGSTAISLGNIYTPGGWGIKINGKAKSIIDGNTILNINGPANAAGITAGGLATAIGGTATSNVTGTSNININSVVDDKNLEGITAGIFGGGMAISTLGGTATSEVTEGTNIKVNDGFSVGVIGGGLAASTDASQIFDKLIEEGVKLVKKENGEYWYDFGTLKPTISLDGISGGTSKVKSGDININLTGKTSAALVLGNGIAISHQNADSEKLSSSIVEAGNIKINVDLEQKLNGQGIADNKVMEKVAALLKNLKNVVKPGVGTNINDLIGSMQNTVGALKDGGIVVGLTGNGLAVARDKATSTVTANDITMNLNGGYIVGVSGNGIATGNSSSTVTANSSTITVDGAEVIGLTGNGLALDHGVVKDDKSSTVTIKDSTINVKSGSVDGIFGGGIALTKAHENSKAIAETTGKSTVNINGGTIDKFGYNHIAGIVKNHLSFDRIAEVGKDVAILGGGVASRYGEAKVAESEINVNGGTINGDIVAGGIAVSGGESIVEKSTININGGTINGNLIGTGLASEKTTSAGGIIDEAGKVFVGESNLNINEYNGTIKSINDFHNITIGKNTELTTDGITVIAKADGTRGNMVNNGVVNISENNGQRTDRALVTLAYSDLTNNGIMGVYLGDKVSVGEGVTTNTGKVQILGNTAEELKGQDVLSTLFGNEYNSTGMLVDKNGNVILDADDTVIGNKKLTTTDINKNDGVYLADGVTIEGGETPIDLTSLNIIGSVKTEDGVKINDTTINLANKGNFTIVDNGNLSISSGVVNGNGKDSDGNYTTDIKFGNGSSLTLEDVVFNGAIGEGNGTLTSLGDNLINGKLAAKTVNIGDKDNNSILTLSADSTVGTGSEINIDNGQLGLVIGDNEGTNALGGTNGITITGNTEKEGDLLLKTDNLTGKEVTVDLGDNTFKDVDAVISGVYTIKGDTNTITGTGNDSTATKITLEYNTKLYEENDILNNINNAAVYANDKFSSDVAIRKGQLDTIYGSNIYSETVKASYENIKLSEDTLIGMSRVAKTGEWAASGKAIYDKNEYDREGTLGKSYESKLETTGLLANLEYGLNDNTSVGFAFSGSKQDLDSKGGSADGDLFYLGAYAKKLVGNYDLTAGIGYQLGKYDTDNTAGRISSSDSYDTNSFSAYGQVKYIAKFDGVSFEPKLRVGYTYVDQDDIKDSYFKLTDANMSTVDTTVGLDIVKEITLDKSNLRLVAGVSYTKLFGDIDNEFTGTFYGPTGEGSFNVLGANLTENSVNFILGAEVEKESGLLYNIGASYTMGSNNTENYGANLGIGYKF